MHIENISLDTIQNEIAGHEDLIRDFTVPVNSLKFEASQSTDTPHRIHLERDGYYWLTPTACRQFAAWLGIPWVYFERMQTFDPCLLNHNVSKWLRHQTGHRFIRTLEAHARAVVSNRYAPLDNARLWSVVYPILLDADFEITGFHLDMDGFTLRAVSRKLTAEIAPGDVVQAAITVRNCETGIGSLELSLSVFVLACSNGVTRERSQFSVVRRHLGPVRRGAEVITEYLPLDDGQVYGPKFWRGFQGDVFRAASADAFGETVERLRAARHDYLLCTPEEAAAAAGAHFALTKAEQEAAVKHWLSGHAGSVTFTRYGLIQAITRAAQDAATFHRRMELEAIGGRIIDLPAASWQRFASLK